MKQTTVIFFLCFFCLNSCSVKYLNNGCFCNYKISIASGVIIKEQNIESALREIIKPANVTKHFFEILIFSYSSGKDVFKYNERISDDLIIDNSEGAIEALVKKKHGGRVIEVFFIKAEGDSKQRIISNFTERIKDILCE